jgi:L-fuconolactonase
MTPVPITGTVPITDTHHHVWDLSAHDQPWLASDPALAPLRRNFALADLVPQAAALGVTATVLVQTVTESWETPELLTLASAGGLVAGVVGWVDLESPSVAEQVARLQDRPGGAHLVGIRHPLLAEPDAGWLARPAVLRGLAAVAAAGLAFDVVGEPRHLPAAAQAAAALPGLQFVLDHLGNPEVAPEVAPSWAGAIKAMAASPNVVCKLSGFLGVPAPGGAMDATGHLQPYYETALQAFGPGRLMFGSDWPVSTLEAGYGGVLAAARALTAGLSEAEQGAVFSGNAKRVYRLPG